MDPRTASSESRRQIAVALVILGLLIWVDLFLMLALHVDGGADIDSVNFGLSAFRYNVLEQQPHPPGYPGYVLWLKLIHLLAPDLGPLAIAEWGSRLCGLACIPASYWACRQLMGENKVLVRPLLAATLAAFHPMLVKYGSDGQSHAGEALCTLVLFGLAAATVHSSSRWGRLLLAAALALAGSVRPNIPLLLSPLLVWVYWRRPGREWLPALGLGLLTTLLWFVPLVAMSGGWTLYWRASTALLTDFHTSSSSLFSSQASWRAVMSNVELALIGGMIAAIPFVAWSRGQERWRRTIGVTLVISVVFYAVSYCAETGYLIGVAALSCLVPASWPSRVGRSLRCRMALAVAVGPLFLFLAPASMSSIVSRRIDLPSFSAAMDKDAYQRAYGELVCASAAGRASLALSNGSQMGVHRGVPLSCPNLRFASWLGHLSSRPEIDNVIIAGARGMVALPTGIPLEVGPPVALRVAPPIERVLVAPDATSEFVDMVAGQALCPRMIEAELVLGDDRVLVWPARCLPRLRIGKNTLLLADSLAQ